MARPPSVEAAPTDYAAWMRCYRAYRAGRGPNPGPRRDWVDRVDALRDGQERETVRSAWDALRRAVLELGGISPNADYGYDAIPPSVYRVSGKPADLVAALLDENGSGFHYVGDVELMCDAWKLYEEARKC